MNTPAIAHVQLVSVNADDYEGLYVDGVLRCQNRTVGTFRAMALLKEALDKLPGMATFTYEVRWVDPEWTSWLDQCKLPLNLSDCKLEEKP